MQTSNFDNTQQDIYFSSIAKASRITPEESNVAIGHLSDCGIRSMEYIAGAKALNCILRDIYIHK